MSYPFAVLLIEDDVPTLSLLETIAKREGFDALLADDGEKAMSILMHQTVDAMVLDLLSLDANSSRDMVQNREGSARPEGVI